MATMLFYRKPVPLNTDMHLNMRLAPAQDGLAFAEQTNSIPLAAVEFVDAAREYPIVFTGKEGGPYLPIVLVGIRHNENLLVAPDNRWDGRYIPAFVRRYPFVLAEKEGADDFNVYIDEAYAGFGSAEGERLFGDDGEQTPMLKQALEFLGNYQGEIVRTRLFVERLQALDLLVPRVLDVTGADDAPLVLQGFSVVDEKRLSALGDADLLALAREGYLALIYTHLGSLGNVARLSERLAARLAASDRADEAPATAPAAPRKKRTQAPAAQEA